VEEERDKIMRDEYGEEVDENDLDIFDFGKAKLDQFKREAKGVLIAE
jgi:hypothetical protein